MVRPTGPGSETRARRAPTSAYGKRVGMVVEGELGAVSPAQLERISSLASRFGEETPRIIDAISDVLERTLVAGSGLLPAAEAEYVARYSGLSDPEHGPGSGDYAVIVARQAALDQAMFISTQHAADLLGVDASRVRHRAGAGLLVSERFGRELRYPLWQFDTRTTPAKPLPHLTAIRAAIRPNVHPAEVAGIMSANQPDLMMGGNAMTPREWLLAGGNPEPVIDLLENDVLW